MKKTSFKSFLILLVFTLVLSSAACKESGGDDSSMTESVIEFIEYDDNGSETQPDESSSSDSGSSGKSDKDKYAVTIETENIAGDSKAQQELQAKLKDSAKGKTLTILSTWGEDGIMNQCYRSMFKALCGGNLEIIRCADWSGMQQKLASMHAANNAPDLYEVTNQDFPSMVYRGIIEPLSDHINFNDAVYTDADRKWLSQLQFNGKNYFWPTLGDSTNAKMCVFVNRSLLEQFGIAKNQWPDALVKANNWTWDTMFDLEKRTTDKGKGIYGLVAPENASLSYGMVLTTGEDLIKFSSNGVLSNFTSKNVTRALNMYKKIADPNYHTYDKANVLFESGKAAMLYTSVSNIGGTKLNAMANDGIIDIVPLARDPQQSNYNLFGSITGIAVPSGSKNKETAITFIRMLRASDYYNKQVNEIYHKQYKYTDAAKQYNENTVKKYNIVPCVSLGIKEILGTTWEATGQDFIQGSVTWETRAAEYSPKIQSILDKLG